MAVTVTIQCCTAELHDCPVQQSYNERQNLNDHEMIFAIPGQYGTSCQPCVVSFRFVGTSARVRTVMLEFVITGG